jgi:VWFA-related protein
MDRGLDRRISMTGGTVLAGILGAVFALASVQAQSAQPSQGLPAAGAQQPAPRFRSSVDVVSVAAVVRDKKGRFVKDLSREDFEVVEGGERRRIIDFRAELNGPVKLGVLLDISGSMRVGQRASDAEAVARHLFASLGSADQAAVYTFDTMLSEAQGFTSDRGALESALGTVEKPYGQTSLYDAIAQTSRLVAGASASGPRALPQRSAVVVITDGVDTRSRMTPDQVSEVASSIDVPVYIVAVVAGVDDPRANPEDRRAAALASDLQSLSRRTGGAMFIASSPAEFSVAARQTVDELRHQYLIAFEASSRPGWRPVEVRTRQGSLIVRARTGYAGGSPSS